MPRAPRKLFEGGIYHVYYRVSRGEHIFANESEAGRFVARLAGVSHGDELVVMAWCVMSNHYHLAVRTGNVPLSRADRNSLSPTSTVPRPPELKSTTQNTNNDPLPWI